MNWEMLAAIGQLAAVFVGIPSLIYLAVQIREQTKERRQSAVNVLTAQWGDLTCALHDSAELSAIFLRGVQSFADLVCRLLLEKKICFPGTSSTSGIVFNDVTSFPPAYKGAMFFSDYARGCIFVIL